MMALYSVTQNKLDRTVKIFDAFYANEIIVPADQYDIIYGYFSSVCETKQIAANFTALFFRIAQEGGIGTIELLDLIKKNNNKLDMNKIIAYYLNTFKSKSTLYGVSIVPRPNQPVARNVVQ